MKVPFSAALPVFKVERTPPDEINLCTFIATLIGGGGELFCIINQWLVLCFFRVKGLDSGCSCVLSGVMTNVPKPKVTCCTGRTASQLAASVVCEGDDIFRQLVALGRYGAVRGAEVTKPLVVLGQRPVTPQSRGSQPGGGGAEADPKGEPHWLTTA